MMIHHLQLFSFRWLWNHRTHCVWMHQNLCCVAEQTLDQICKNKRLSKCFLKKTCLCVNIVYIIFNPLTPGTFCQKCIFWTFWPEYPEFHTPNCGVCLRSGKLTIYYGKWWRGAFQLLCQIRYMATFHIPWRGLPCNQLHCDYHLISTTINCNSPASFLYKVLDTQPSTRLRSSSTQCHNKTCHDCTFTTWTQ